MLGAVLIIQGIFIWLLVVSWKNPDWTQRQIDGLRSLPEHRKTFGSLIVLFGLLLIGGLYALTLTPEISEPFTAILFQRLSPFTFWLTGLSAQTLLVLFLLGFGFSPSGLFRKNWVFWLAMALFSLFFVMWGWAVYTTIHSESAITGWNDLGAPILDTQVFVAWLAGMATWGLIYLGRSNSKRFAWLQKLTPKRIDLIIFLALWAGTILLWNSIPPPQSHFLSVPRPPNFELYPNSDALVYDMSAQVLLLGQGLRFANDIFVRRPVLALFFAVLHALAGQNPTAIMLWQIVFLAAAPAFVYLLGQALHNRLTGVIGGVLISLRGATAIALAGVITTSHVKILMADLPAMLVMVIFIFTSVRWLQKHSQNLGLLSGGLLGIAVLIRPELGAAILAIGLISFLVYRPHLRQWLRNGLLFLLGILLVLAPWVYRNWSLTGMIFLDTPTFRTDWLEERYQKVAPPTPSPTSQATEQLQGALVLPGIQATQAPTVPVSSTGLGTGASVIPLNSSAGIARFVSTHFLNSQMQIFLTLPTSFRLLDSTAAFLAHRSPEQFWEECCSSLDYVRRLPYWHKWYGEIPGQATVLLVINLALIGLGIQGSWKRNRWIGILPLSIGFVHLMINALARNSGGRYIQPVDWIGILYFCFGLAIVSVWVVNLFTRRRVDVEMDDSPAAGVVDYSHQNILRSPQFYILAFLLLAIGSAAPILERIIQPRYPDQVQAQMLDRLFASPLISEGQKQTLAKMLKEDGLASVGRALYPRFYKANQGEPGTNNPFAPKPYSWVGFYLTDQVYQPVILPFEHQPGAFPNGSDVLVIGCPDGQAAAAAIFKSLNGPPASVLFRFSGASPLICHDTDAIH
jgi:hypothetical protein